jgi:hypothetical protein
MNTPERLQKARAKVIELIYAWNMGEMNLDRAVDAIVEVWTGQADPIVRVGEQTHKPEIQS